MAHVVTWISVAIIVLAFIFFIVSVIVLEYGVKVNANGNLVIPWYYWIFFVGAGVMFLAFVILQLFVPHSDNKEKVTTAVTGQPDSWVQGDKLYTGGGQYVQTIPPPGTPDPNGVREMAMRSPHYPPHSVSTHSHSHYSHNQDQMIRGRMAQGEMIQPTYSSNFATNDVIRRGGLDSLARTTYLE